MAVAAICRHGRIAIIISITIASSFAATPAPATQATRPVLDPYFPELGSTSYDVLHYDLAVTATPGAPTMSGHASLTARSLENLDGVDLDLVGLNVSTATIDGEEAEVSQSPSKLHLVFDRQVRRGSKFTLEITYAGTPTTGTAANTTLENGWIDNGSSIYAFGEPDGASRWFPANDIPSDKASFEFRITTPNEFVALANGHLTRQTQSGDTTTYVWDAPDPMATYLAVLAIGHYTVIESPGVPGVRIRNAVPSGTAATPPPEMNSIADIIDFFQSRFGPFPFDVYGVIVPDPPLTFAFESQTFTLGDSSIAHELAHQWFGDSVTPKTWRDLWLAESFATYADWLWLDHTGTTPIAQSVTRATAAVSGSTVAPRDPSRTHMFSEATYERGALFLNALRSELGDQRFFQALRTFTHRFAGSNATTTDFLHTTNEVSPRPLDRLFARWLGPTQPPGTPSQ